MTRDEAIGVLRILTAAWPNAALSDDTVELWLDYLAAVDAEDGRVVATELVLSEQWLPTIARFREAVVARWRRQRERQRFAERALPSGETVTERDAALVHIAALRAGFGAA